MSVMVFLITLAVGYISMPNLSLIIMNIIQEHINTQFIMNIIWLHINAQFITDDYEHIKEHINTQFIMNIIWLHINAQFITNDYENYPTNDGPPPHPSG